MMTPCEYDLPTQWRGRKRAILSVALRRHYTRIVGPIPEGRELHHECEDPACSNVRHLEPLTPSEHTNAHRARRLWQGFDETAFA